jgi:hypothetical protein
MPRMDVTGALSGEGLDHYAVVMKDPKAMSPISTDRSTFDQSRSPSFTLRRRKIWVTQTGNLGAQRGRHGELCDTADRSPSARQHLCYSL